MREYALARACADAARADAPADAAVILPQATVEQKAGQRQRCLEITSQLPASANEATRRQMGQVRSEAVRQLQKLARQLEHRENERQKL